MHEGDVNERIIVAESELRHLRENARACKAACVITIKEIRDDVKETEKELFERINALELSNAKLLGIMVGIATLASIITTAVTLILKLMSS